MFATAVGFIRRQFLVVISVLPLTLGLAAAYLYMTPRLYSAQASVLINTGKVQVFKQSILGDDPVNMAMVDSLTEVLKSGTFALSIINKLRLDQDPEFVGPAGFIGHAANHGYCTPSEETSRNLTRILSTARCACSNIG